MVKKVTSVDEKDDKEKKKHKVFYFGADESFLSNLVKKFRLLYSLDINFVRFDSNDEKEIQGWIRKVAEERPKLLLVDFSKNEKAMLHFTRVWNRQNFYTKIPIIGLSDYTQKKLMVTKAIMTGIPSIHVKSLEYEAIIHNIILLAYPDDVTDHGFATAELNDPIFSWYPCKVSMANENFIRIESNYPMKAKQVLRLTSHWDKNLITRSNLMMCVDQSQENIYYHYKFTQVLQMAHADPVEQAEGMTQEELQAKQVKRQEIVAESRHKFKKWLGEHSYDSRPKFLKAYVVDKSMSFFDNMPLSDSYDFVFRTQPFIANAKRELTNIKPQLILFNLEDVAKEELEANSDIAHTFNDSRMLQHMVKTLREVAKERPPIIVVFNTGEKDSNYLQKALNYKSVLAVSEEMTVGLTLKMAEMLKQKIAPSLPQPAAGDIYIDKSSPESYAEIESSITLLGCSENDIFFNSEEEIQMGTVIRVALPVPMYITVLVPPEYCTIDSEYYGVINGIGEEERKELRRFINSVFFRGLDTKKEVEKAEYAKINQTYIDKQSAQEEAAKLAASKEVEEQAEKAAAEEAAQKESETEAKAKAIVDDLE